MLEKVNHELTVTLQSDREIVLTRSFARPRGLLFEAWTQPEHVRQWWGCDGSTVTHCEMDLRPGGTWRLKMRLADGSEHSFHGEYREIVPNERLVYSECYENSAVGSPEWLTTVTFEDAGGETKLTHAILHGSREMRDGHLNSGMETGAVQTMDRLDRHAASMVEETVAAK
jgi:uncharacterized protein YndB with AHSA1/START domain